MGRGVVTAECSSTSNAGSVTVLTKGEVGRASADWSLNSVVTVLVLGTAKKPRDLQPS